MVEKKPCTTKDCHGTYAHSGPCCTSKDCPKRRAGTW